jgi:uncharacterized protein YdeI (YjbR/CyaY-like superfamily)
VPAVKVDPAKVLEFESFEAFYAWLRDNHDSADEVWIKVHKVGSGLRSITPKEAIDAALCWGWIDAIRKGFDEKSFLQRYTTRRPKSVWSRINVDNVERLIAAGLMTEHGLEHVEAAKADGRWDRAYAGSREMELPEDLLAAIRADPRALATFEKLNSQNRYALAIRVHNLRTEAGRRRKIAEFVAMLARGEAPYPQKGL